MDFITDYTFEICVIALLVVAASALAGFLAAKLAGLLENDCNDQLE